MTIREWVRNREINGFPTFSVADARLTFSHSSEQVIKNDLFRLSTQGIVSSVYKGFYVVIPPHYALKRAVPPVYYVDQLLRYLDKPYYVSLLNAAEIHGAAHQRPQKFFIMTVPPKSSVSPSKNNALVWVYRKEIPSEFLLSKNSETGVVYYSNAELTAIDIVQYAQYIGGLSRVATVLAELAEKLDFCGASQRLFDYTTTATIQRLGYILEEVLGAREVADVLYAELTSYAGRFKYVPLSTNKPKGGEKTNRRWKVDVNTTIEVDEI
ncbi:MAG: type IV toxin-antitoxin system AbiEi family antitoxin [Bacteroides sp.]|nr:type IV toxin-antitoxin system AbiEi family antitoxin [Ruminococcus flavefaciens]MCM1555754.1 type IV toxin-antitoxin system AbiEi family antitoxin [Bacteroides sp.]